MANDRKSPIEIDKETFKKIGYQLIDTIAQFIDTIDKHPVTTGETPRELQKIIGTSSLPENGTPVEELLAKTADVLCNHSLLNGHP